MSGVVLNGDCQLDTLALGTLIAGDFGRGHFRPELAAGFMGKKAASSKATDAIIVNDIFKADLAD